MRKLTEQEISTLDFDKDFIKVTYDFSNELGDKEILVSELLEFLTKKIIQFEGTNDAKDLSTLHDYFAFLYDEDPKAIIGTKIITCRSSCGRCGCRPTRQCRIYCASSAQPCIGCNCIPC